MAADSTTAVLRHEVDSSWLLFLTSATSNILLYKPSHDDSAESGRVFNAFNVFSVFSP
jgi:hypothetical protein